MTSVGCVTVPENGCRDSSALALQTGYTKTTLWLLALLCTLHYPTFLENVCELKPCTIVHPNYGGCYSCKFRP